LSTLKTSAVSEIKMLLCLATQLNRGLTARALSYLNCQLSSQLYVVPG